MTGHRDLLRYQPIEWARFWGSKHVQSMSSTEVRGVYALFLGLMWENGGWLPAKDEIIAHRLLMPVRRWKSAYKSEILATCRRVTDPIMGQILTHEVVDEVWQSTLKRIADNQRKTARGRAQVLENRRRAKSVTEAKPKSVTDPVTDQSNAAASTSVTDPVTAGKEKEKLSLPINRQRESFSENLPNVGLRQMPGDGPADQPFEENGHAIEPASERGGDRAGQGEVPEPRRAAGDQPGPSSLFGRLEARRKSREAQGGEEVPKP